MSTIEENGPDLFGRLEELVRIAEFATGAELARRGGTVPRFEPVSDSVAASIQTVTLFKTNGYRKGATVYNDSTATLYLRLGPKASLQEWTVKLNQDDYYELPANYRGPVTAIFSAAGGGQARTTEYGW